MSATVCRWCPAEVVILLLCGGRARTFDRLMVAAGGDVDGFVPVRRDSQVAMVPVRELSPSRVSGVRWVATAHTCLGYWLAKRERSLEVDSLADAVGTIFGGAL